MKLDERYPIIGRHLANMKDRDASYEDRLRSFHWMIEYLPYEMLLRCSVWLTDWRIRLQQDRRAESGVEIELAPPLLEPVEKSRYFSGASPYWMEPSGVLHFADSLEQAQLDQREYIIEVHAA